MKRISLALAVIGLSASAFAALPAATEPTIVSVPQLPGGFVVGVSGYYLQPTNSNGDLDYAIVNTNNATTPGGDATVFGSSLKNVDPGYDWGWGVNVGYIFPSTGNDLNLSYFQLDTNDNSTVTGDNLSPVANSFDLFPANLNNSFPVTIIAATKAEYQINQVDLTAGQYIDVGCRLSLHPNVGLRWAEVERELTSNWGLTGTGEAFVGTFPITVANNIIEKSDFEGIGPLVGLDASYYIANGFGLAGHFDAALLVGNINSSINENYQQNQAAPGPGILAGSGSFNANNTRRLVPVVDGKLGANYTYVFNNTANSDLTLEAGWMMSNYFNAVDRLATSLNNIGAIGNLPSGITGHTTSDLGLSGPYVSLVLHI